MGSETLHNSVREASATDIPLIEICNKLLFTIVSVTHSLSTTHSLVFPFLCFNCCFVGYILLLQVARELSRFCKMARRSEEVGPRCSILCIPLRGKLQKKKNWKTRKY